jgi:phospholipid/cholesterol/gamma-HCH transport system substrate-binding protein
MSEQAMRFRLGVFVLASLALLGVLVIMFGSFPTFVFKRPNIYTIYFAYAPGVDTGTPVRRSGIHIGEVRDIELDDELGKVKVVVAIDRKYIIREDERPTLVYSVLGGDTSIDFIPDPKATNRAPVPPGSALEGKRQEDVITLLADVVPSTRETLERMRQSMEKIDTLVPGADESMKAFTRLSRKTDVLAEQIGETNKDVQLLVKDTRTLVPELKKTNDEIQLSSRNIGKVAERLDVIIGTNQDTLVKIIENLNKTLLQMGSLFSDENQRNLTAILKNVKTGSDDLDKVAKTTEELLRDSQRLIRRIDSTMQQTDAVMQNLQQATKPLAERGGSVMKNLDESADKLNRTLTDVRELLKTVTQSDGTLGRFLNDPSLYNHLDEAACSFAKLVPKMQWIIKDVEVFTDKLARHPELIGLGGAVRPSSGLKDSFPLGPTGPQHP